MKNGGEKYPTSFCQDWVSTLQNTNKMEGYYDEAVRHYCKNHPKDSRCACMVTPDNITKLQDMATTSKVCWYKPCQDNKVDNYITNSMLKQKKNCVSTACLIDAGDIDLTGSGNQVKFKNECGSSVTGVPEAVPAPDTVTPTPDTVIPTPDTGVSPEPVSSSPDTSTASSNGQNFLQKNKILLGGGGGLTSSISLFICCCCLIIIILILVAVSTSGEEDGEGEL